MHKRLVLATVSSFTVFGSMANAQAVISVAPTSQTVTAGGEFTVDVNISNVSDLYGYQFDLTFNPQVLSAVSSSEGPFLGTAGSTFFIPGTNDNTNGTVSATADTIISAVPGANGSGNLAVFTFDAIKNGVSSIVISGVNMIDSAFNSISDTTTSGSVTVTSGHTFAAPEIDAASATSALTLLLGGLAVLRDRRTIDPRVTGSADVSRP
jgi:hypothetical protein